MNEVINFTQATMSSREIADLVESRHDKVKQSIERLATRGAIVQPPMGDEQMVDTLGRPRRESVYWIGKRDSYVIVAQLSPEFTARLVDRWQELELQAAGRFQIPQSLSAALRLAADQQEQLEAQQRQLEAARPAVEFVERYVESRSAKSLREAAKVLGLKEREFIAQLMADRILFRQSGSLLPFAYYQHHGYFTVKTGESNGHAFQQTKLTPKGLAWVAKRFGLINEQVA